MEPDHCGVLPELEVFVQGQLIFTSVLSTTSTHQKHNKNTSEITYENENSSCDPEPMPRDDLYVDQQTIAFKINRNIKGDVAIRLFHRP
eukprot:Ihof_evm2s378 gene=Ihof_evmTU2s378